MPKLEMFGSTISIGQMPFPDGQSTGLKNLRQHSNEHCTRFRRYHHWLCHHIKNACSTSIASDTILSVTQYRHQPLLLSITNKNAGFNLYIAHYKRINSV